MGDRHVSVMIAAPPEIVFGLYADPGRAREWLSGVREVRTAGPTDQPGGRAVIVYRWPFKMAAEGLRVQRPPRHVQRLKELLGLVTCTTTARFRQVQGGTHLRLGMHYRVAGGPIGGLFESRVGDEMSRRSAGTSPGSRRWPRSKPGPLRQTRRRNDQLSEQEKTMKVFVAGATGAIGKQLIPQLVAAGHKVTGMIRSPEKADALRALGAKAAVADGLDRTAVREAVLRAEPEAVIHQMTSLSGTFNLKKFDEFFALTNRLRTEGTDYLLEAAQAAGARRFLAQSQCNDFERTGALVKSEDDPLDPDPPAALRRLLAALRHLEAATLGAAGIEGLALRYANFYGPGTNLASGGEMVELVRKRRLPIIGDGSGVWSLIHMVDAAAATVAALERGAPGIYNVADDEPAPASVWLPELARVLDAKPPLRVPVWLGRLAAGEAGVLLFTRLRGASNAKAKRELGWELRYPSWRDGFRHDLAAQPNEKAA